MIIDPYDPSPEYVRDWMYSNKPWPDQDWDIFLDNGKCDVVLLDCARDGSCPNQKFALHCLYFLVGNFVYSKLRRERMQSLVVLLDQVTDSDLIELVIWKREASALLTGKKSFEYEYWCQHST